MTATRRHGAFGALTGWWASAARALALVHLIETGGDGGQGRVLARRRQIQADLLGIGRQGDASGVVEHEALARELIVAAHHIGRAAQFRLGDGAAHAGVGAQFDVQAAAAQDALASAQARVERTRTLAIPMPTTGLPAGRAVLTLDQAGWATPEGRTIVGPVDLKLAGAERVAITGPNGAASPSASARTCTGTNRMSVSGRCWRPTAPRSASSRRRCASEGTGGSGWPFGRCVRRTMKA